MRPRRHAGFTLIELLIVIAIIGILASMLIPNLLDALEKAKQKRTMADMRNAGTGMMAWLTDQSNAAAAGRQVAATIDLSEFEGINAAALRAEVVPRYLQELVDRDAWRNEFDFYLRTVDPQGANIMAIRSGGKDGVFSGDTYQVAGFDVTQYNEDLVWADGFWVRWPGKNS